MTLALTEEDLAQMLTDLTVSVQKQLWESYFPDEGPFSRHCFPKHIEYMDQTLDKKVLTIFGANRSSKTVTMCYIASCWLMGKYPPWWKGRKFEKPVKGWVAGQTTELVRDSSMLYLFGSDGVSGMVDANHIEHIYWSQQAPGVINRVLVRTDAGGLSEVTFKTYDQGWQRFQSGTIDFALLDEEMHPKVYSETVTRTATTKGVVLVGFTGLQGVTPLVAHLWPESVGLKEDDESRFKTFIGWKDVPESLLPMAERKRLMAQYMPNEIKARTEGIPYIGAGMVYPVAEEEFTVEPFEIPAHWPRAFALDPGYTSKTAAIWGAWDQDDDIIYLYSEYYQDLLQPAAHVDSFRKRGSWIPCIIDPAGANMDDGEKIKAVYKEAFQAVNENWPVSDAKKAITAGIMEVYARLSTGRLKVFSTLQKWGWEFRQYIKDDKGKIVESPDHLLDCMRYLCMGTGKFITKPPEHKRVSAPHTAINDFGL